MNISIKICGVSNKETIDIINTLNISYVGFVFFKKSPRNISIEKAALLSHILRADINTVALCVDPKDDFLNTLSQSSIRLDYIQLHGQETPKRLTYIKEKMKCHVIKSFALDKDSCMNSIDENIKKYNFLLHDKVLFDAKPKTNTDLPGGNGKTFDWNILKNYDMNSKIFLSGGLSIDNIHTALDTTKALNVDISSGVEKRPGEKDPLLIKNFVRKIEDYL